MTKKLMSALMIVLFAGAQVVAQDKEHAAPPKAERKTAEATWPEGKLTINYGSPTWKEEFNEGIKKLAAEGKEWRLGNNEPTRATLTSGLDSAQGAIPPGDYTLALKPGADNKWSLLFYEAQTFYDKAFKTWEIPSTGAATELKTPAQNLTIRFDGKNMIVDFGPMSSTWACKPIKVNPPIETEFADAQSKFEVLALPLAGMTFKDTLVGVATTARNGIKVRYHMKLTVDGDKATLNMVNERAAGLAKEKEQLEDITKRIAAMLEKNPERKETAEPILIGMKKSLEEIDTMSKALERLQPAVIVNGTMTKRDKPATELGLSHDRPTGAIVLKLALENSDAAFEIKPGPQFRKRRTE
jgi:hypothetical protein